MTQNIPVIVITGGTDPRKARVLEHFQEHFTSQGYQVEIITDVAAELGESGKGPLQIGMEEFQRLVFSISTEEEWEAKAKLAKEKASKPLIFACRGAVDGAAYIKRAVIEGIWEQFGHNPIHLRDERYVGVIHVATQDKIAAAQDRRTLAAWVGTPHLAFIDHRTSDTRMIEHATAWAEYFLSEHEHERKFKLLKPFHPSLLPRHAQCIEISQSYVMLPEASKSHRVRKRGQNGVHSFIQSLKRMVGTRSSTEVEDLIDEDEYSRLRKEYGMPGYAEVVKHRWCFVAEGHYWELDVFRDLPGLVIMEGEMPHPEWELTLPSWIGDDFDEVTGQREYANKAIAARIAEQRLAA